MGLLAVFNKMLTVALFKDYSYVCGCGCHCTFKKWKNI